MFTRMDDFFAFARERHQIYLKRTAGEPYPWTKDPVLQTGRFTNVFRELDRTTTWFRLQVRDRMRESPDVLLATVIFRWFNRISTGEAIFCQPDLFGGQSAFERFLGSRDTNDLKAAIVKVCGSGPYVTGAYTINTSSWNPELHLNKLDGVLKLIEMWLEYHPDWHGFATLHMQLGSLALKTFCEWARSPCLAGFMTYELACDLRWTRMLDRAPDVCSWANPGPGAKRGLNRLYGRPTNQGVPTQQAIEEMVALLEASRLKRYWPQMSNGLYMMEGGRYGGAVRMHWQNYNFPLAMTMDAWPVWELREVEHTLCEWDKFKRCKAGEGQTRGKFQPR